MSVKEQILTLLKMYSDGSYRTNDFCALFCGLYYFESSGRDFFDGEERGALDELANAAERYSDDEEDLLRYPDTYRDEKAVVSAFQTVKEVFGL